MPYLRPWVFYPCVLALAALEVTMLFIDASLPGAVSAFVAWFAGVWIGLFVRERQILKAVDELL